MWSLLQDNRYIVANNKLSVDVISNSSRTHSQNIVISISILLGVLLIHVTLACHLACTTPYPSLVVREHYYPYGPMFITRYNTVQYKSIQWPNTPKLRYHRDHYVNMSYYRTFPVYIVPHYVMFTNTCTEHHDLMCRVTLPI